MSIAIGVLALALVYQQWYHHRIVKDLIDRLMSRSITEFERAKNPAPPRVAIQRDEPLENLDRIIG